MKFHLILLILLMLLLGCSSHGNLKIYNQTNHNLYFSIKNITQTLTPQTSYEISLYTNKKFIFNEATKKYTLYLEGETFLMYDGLNPVTETKITLTANKTLKIYAHPTNACIKVINDSKKTISNVSYQRIYPDSILKPELLIEEVPPYSIKFKQIPYSCETDSFNVKFSYMNENSDTVYTHDYNLKLDELFLLEIKD